MPARTDLGQRIVGIGAVNLDYVVSSSNFLALGRLVRQKFLDEVILGAERIISSNDFHRLFNLLPPQSYRVRPGGSALNAITALAGLRTGRPLAFIGACGSSSDSENVRNALNFHGVDVENLRVSEPHLSGSCLALEIGGDRSLLTTRGANDNLSAILVDEVDRLAQIIADSAVIHISSLIDADAPAAIAAVLQLARTQNPELQVSFDPGFCWSQEAKGNGEIARLASMANWIFLNSQEFGLWKVSQRLETMSATVFCKHPNKIGITQRRPAFEVFEVRNEVLDSSQIKDSTGAGDTFAGGVLGVLSVDPKNFVGASRLGLSMVQRKLRTEFSEGDFPDYRDLWVEGKYLG